MQFFMCFHSRQLNQLYTANFLYVFNPFIKAVQFRFSQFDGQKCFFPKLNKYRKVGKSLYQHLSLKSRINCTIGPAKQTFEHKNDYLFSNQLRELMKIVVNGGKKA